MANLTAFDVVVLLLIVFGGFAGLARGFVAEVLSLLAWVGAFFAVRLLYPIAKPYAISFTGTEAGGTILAFAVIFLVALMLFKGIAGRAGGVARNSLVGPLDRLLGLGFGAFKGLLGASVIWLLGTMVFDVLDPGEPRPDWLRAARTAPLVEATSKTMVDFVEERRKRGAADEEQPKGSTLDRMFGGKS